MKVLVTQLCLTPCDFMDSSPPGSSLHWIFQARILEWVAIFFSRGSSWPGTEPWSPTLQANSLLFEPLGKPSVKLSWIVGYLALVQELLGSGETPHLHIETGVRMHVYDNAAVGPENSPGNAVAKWTRIARSKHRPLGNILGSIHLESYHVSGYCLILFLFLSSLVTSSDEIPSIQVTSFSLSLQADFDHLLPKIVLWLCSLCLE